MKTVTQSTRFDVIDAITNETVAVEVTATQALSAYRATMDTAHARYQRVPLITTTQEHWPITPDILSAVLSGAQKVAVNSTGQRHDVATWSDYPTEAK